MGRMKWKSERGNPKDRMFVRVNLVINPVTGECSGLTSISGLLLKFLIKNEDALPRALAICLGNVSDAFCDNYSDAKQQLQRLERLAEPTGDSEEDN